ncbi:MAG: hypothetical protein OXC31_04405 [Spirochaetaceae bacterium]|nr:hypothetical protein [Spirochaetaceae bacterium]
MDGCHIHECRHALEVPKIFSTAPEGVARITPRSATGWRSLPAGEVTPLEFPIELGRIADRQIVEGRRLQDRYGPERVRWHALATGVLITAGKDGSLPLASLTPGEWSAWLPVRYGGSVTDGHVRFALLALSPDARELTLYSTNVFPAGGDWTYPAALAPELTEALGPFLPNIGGCDTEQGFARMGTRFGAAGLGLWGDRVGDVIFTQTALAGSHGRQLPVAERGNGSLQGFLVMAGPDYHRGHRMDRTAWIVDVAPPIAHTMGLRYPRDSEGAVLHQALDRGVEAVPRPRAL